MRWISHASFDEMFFHVSQFEFLFKIICNEISVDAVLASVDVGRDKATLRERMNADVALGDDNEPAPAAGVFDMIVGSGQHNRLHKRTHMQGVAQFREAGENGLFAIETLRIPAVTVDGDVFSEMDGHTRIVYRIRDDAFCKVKENRRQCVLAAGTRSQ